MKGVVVVDDHAMSNWVQQDQAVLSMLVASLSKEVLYLTLGHATSHSLLKEIENAFVSVTRAHSLGLFTQLQELCQGDCDTPDLNHGLYPANSLFRGVNLINWARVF
nr:eukaryotic translation initiation factor 3 subunit F-like [Ipomoea batatas]